MKVLHEICDVLEDELEDIVKSGDMNAQDLEVVYKSVDIIKDVETIKAMRESSWGDTSRDDGYSRRPMYYDDGYTMARGSRMSRDNRGGGYTRHDEKEMLEDKIDELKRQLNQMR